MIRKLSAGEYTLPGILLLLVFLFGYLYLFYLPVTQEWKTLENEIASYEDEILAAQLRVEQKRKMQKEVDEVFAKEPASVSIAAFDNLQPLLLALNSILKDTAEYSLSFGNVDTSDTIVRRNLSMHFTSPSYSSAVQILEKLQNIACRCALDYLNIRIDTNKKRDIVAGVTEYVSEEVSVDASIVFFEYVSIQPSAS